MKTRSAKNKGRRLQNEVRDKLRARFAKYGFEDDDFVSAVMGESGVDVKLSPTARKIFPYSPECKNQESLSIWSALKQAENNAKEGTHPVLFFKRNYSKTYAVVEIDHFLDLIESGVKATILMENE